MLDAILIFKTNNANSRLFGELERGSHIPRSKPYSMVIFPAYEGDSALNHMLTWYKVIFVIGQSKFEV